MNRDYIIRQILKLTTNWEFNDWERFRRYNNYWEVKDRCFRNDGYFNTAKYNQFLLWKLEMIKDHIYN